MNVLHLLLERLLFVPPYPHNFSEVIKKMMRDVNGRTSRELKRGPHTEELWHGMVTHFMSLLQLQAASLLWKVMQRAVGCLRCERMCMLSWDWYESQLDMDRMRPARKDSRLRMKVGVRRLRPSQTTSYHATTQPRNRAITHFAHDADNPQVVGKRRHAAPCEGTRTSPLLRCCDRYLYGAQVVLKRASSCDTSEESSLQKGGRNARWHVTHYEVLLSRGA